MWKQSEHFMNTEIGRRKQKRLEQEHEDRTKDVLVHGGGQVAADYYISLRPCFLQN
jgi:lysine/ornithine N-monooxygenase